jgi:hypothetical protein
VVGDMSIPLTFPVAVTPLSASKVTVADWPIFSLIASDSVNSPVTFSFEGSASSMKPLLEEEPLDELLLLLPEDPDEPLEEPPPEPEEPDELEEELDEAVPLEEPPTVPFTETTVPEKGAVSFVPARLRSACL